MGLLSPAFTQRIDQKLALLNKRRPIPAATVTKLKEQFAIELTYNSNAIEGNRLTLKETYLVIAEGITVKGKSLKDHLEAKDHYEAIQYLYDLVEHGSRHTISEHLIRSLQDLVVHGSDKENAGKYRTGDVRITGARHHPPGPHKVPGLMRDFIKGLTNTSKKLHPVEVAALAHHRLVHIHPFADGNGRTARLLMNLMLMQHGFPLVSILKNDHKKYYDVLDRADRGNYEPIVRFIAQAVERALNLYLKVIDTSTRRDQTYLPLSVIANGSTFSAKYLNLLARSGKLEAYKEGRNWVTSREALEQYLKRRQRKR